MIAPSAVLCYQIESTGLIEKELSWTLDSNRRQINSRKCMLLQPEKRLRCLLPTVPPINSSSSILLLRCICHLKTQGCLKMCYLALDDASCVAV